MAPRDISTPHLPPPTLDTMPNIRPGWTPKQSVHLRVAAVEFLRVGHQGQQGEEYLNMFFQEWLMVHGMPVLHDELTVEAVLASYKAVSRPFSASWISNISVFALHSESLPRSSGMPLLVQINYKFLRRLVSVPSSVASNATFSICGIYPKTSQK